MYTKHDFQRLPFFVDFLNLTRFCFIDAEACRINRMIFYLSYISYIIIHYHTAVATLFRFFKKAASYFAFRINFKHTYFQKSVRPALRSCPRFLVDPIEFEINLAFNYFYI